MYRVIDYNGDIELIRQHGIDYMKVLGLEIDPDYFINQWSKFIKSGVGIIFYLMKDDLMVGGIGAIKAPDCFTGKSTLVEMFWYVHPDHRKYGVALYNAMEKYYLENEDIKRFAMIHMEDSMPEKLKTFYTQKGFRLLETQGLKEKL